MCQNVTSIKLNYFFFQCDNGCFALQLSLMILPSRVFHQAPFGFKNCCVTICRSRTERNQVLGVS